MLYPFPIILWLDDADDDDYENIYIMYILITRTRIDRRKQKHTTLLLLPVFVHHAN